MAKECPQCEKENPSSANVCMYCGTRLVENAEMDKMDALHTELSDAKETIQVLKKALADAQTQNEKETVPVKEVTVDENPAIDKQHPPEEETPYGYHKPNIPEKDIQPEKKSSGDVWKGVGVGFLVTIVIVFILIYIIIASL